MRVRAVLLLVTIVLVQRAVSAQEPAAAEPVTLGTLQRAAVALDPRSRQLLLFEAQSRLRERNIQASRLPAVSFDAQLQHQTDVPEPPLRTASGEPIFTALHSTVDTSARIEQRLVDPARQPQVALERAQLAEQQARVRTALFTLRQQVRESFFAAYAMRERMVVLGISLTTLLRSREDAQNRLIAGTAVPADVAQVDAALLDLRQENEALSSQLRGVLERVQALTGRSLSLATPLAVPNPDDTIAQSLSAASGRARPEFQQFSETRTRLSRQLDLVDAQQRPSVSAFGRVGYGRPGLNFIGDRFDVYGVVGLQVHWRPVTWGAAEREREVLRLQQQIVEADEAAFMNGIQAAMPTYTHPLQRLTQALVDDERIIALREQVEQVAAVRLQSGVIPMSEYLARNTELMQARSARAGRRVELAQKATEMLEIAGVEIP